MEILRKFKQASHAALSTAALLESYYGRLVQWANALAHGNAAVAQDMVQELCLYFTLVKPDLSKVKNIEGYLYTCLCHIYSSAMARSSREAERFLGVADFDSIGLAISAP